MCIRLLLLTLISKIGICGHSWENRFLFSSCHCFYGKMNSRLLMCECEEDSCMKTLLQAVLPRRCVLMPLTSCEVTLPLTCLSVFSRFLLAQVLLHISLISFPSFLINNGIFNSVHCGRCHLGQLLLLPPSLYLSFSLALS